MATPDPQPPFGSKHDRLGHRYRHRCSGRMAYACYARLARCRAAHLSLWSRRVNFALDSRGLSSASLARCLCSEARPAFTFAEQRLAVAGPLMSELALEASELERGASVLESLSDLVTLFDLLGVSTRWAPWFVAAVDASSLSSVTWVPRT
eukprot:Skav229789  [mRNA]  locus=scaffold2234:120759:127279:- [translate_table: standard]